MDFLFNRATNFQYFPLSNSYSPSWSKGLVHCRVQLLHLSLWGDRVLPIYQDRLKLRPLRLLVYQTPFPVHSSTPKYRLIQFGTGFNIFDCYFWVNFVIVYLNFSYNSGNASNSYWSDPLCYPYRQIALLYTAQIWWTSALVRVVSNTKYVAGISLSSPPWYPMMAPGLISRVSSTISSFTTEWLCP